MKETVRTAILEAAETVLAEQGLQARMEEIASQAGVSVGTLYNYFEDRGALLEALRANLREELLERMDRALGPDARGRFRERLERYLREFSEYLHGHWKLFSLLAEDGAPAPSASQKRSLTRLLRQRVEELIRLGVEEGVLRREDAALYPALLVGMLRGVYTRPAMEKEPPPAADLVQPLMRFFLEGAGARK